MKLSGIVRDCAVAETIGDDVEISSIGCDSRTIGKGGLFVCMRGGRVDSHTLWREAARNGAVALLTERRLETSLPQVVVEDTRAAVCRAAAAFFGEPAKRLRIVGVVGTNGKTTTAWVIDHILRSLGAKTCLIGTNGVRIGQEHAPSDLTTPDPVELQRILAHAVEVGCDTVVTEISAHAIALRKTEGIVCAACVFTNLSRDHLDFFGDMETYGACKASYFTPAHTRLAVVNVDDALGARLATAPHVPTVTYGIEQPSDAFCINYTPSPHGSVFVANVDDAICDIASPLRGKFNLYNVLAALTCCHALGCKLNDMGKALLDLPQVPGRYQTFVRGGVTVVVDYAHTPDGMEKILGSVREWANGRITTVFGCGGDRDASKRPLMAQAAERGSDRVVVTSDNPRSEDPVSIISQIMTGFSPRAKVVTEPDRGQAIRSTIARASAGDTVVVLGKGNEPYLDVAGKKIPYCDLDVVRDALGARA